MSSNSSNRTSDISPLPHKNDSSPAVKKATKQRITPLLFIDTNILLDFYRARNDAGVSLLEKIDKLHDQTIVTCQVEMEFKKNRQKVITETVTALKLPEFNLPIPSFLSHSSIVKVIKDLNVDVKERVHKLKMRILQTLEKPKTHDLIYQTVQRLFIYSGSLNLKQDSSEYSRIWRRALRRFLKGLPPRKKDDTSAGDALNWEWILHCVEKTKRDVIIVSRDADYGVTHSDKSYANDWLAEEIKGHGKAKRKIILVDRLSLALEKLAIPVTPAELSVERSIIESQPTVNKSELEIIETLVSESINDLSNKDEISSPVNKSEIESLVGESINDLSNKDEISSLIAESNADGWTCSDYNIESVKRYNDVWIADVTFTFSGEQKNDGPWCETEIFGRCLATIDPDKNVSFSEVDAELDRGEEMSHEYEAS